MIRRPSTGAALLLAGLMATEPATGLAQPGAVPDCESPPLRALLNDVSMRMQAMDDEAAVLALEQDTTAAHCPQLDVARSALRGWVEARALARVGGDPSQAGLVGQRIRALEQARDSALAGSGGAMAADYAVAALRAAVAAAQDERPEMALYLAHARSVAERTARPGDQVLLPISIDELEGELWLEVDRYAEAEAAFERATAARHGARAVVGLARTLGRLEQPVKACAAWRRTEGLTMSVPAQLERDRYRASAACVP